VLEFDPFADDVAVFSLCKELCWSELDEPAFAAGLLPRKLLVPISRELNFSAFRAAIELGEPVFASAV